MSLHQEQWESHNNEDDKYFSHETIQYIIELLEDSIDKDDSELIERVIVILKDPYEYEQNFFNDDNDQWA